MRAKAEYPTRHGDQHLPDGSDPIPFFASQTILDFTQATTTDGFIEVTSTDPAFPNDIVTATPLTFDGSQRIQIIFFAAAVDIDQRTIANTGALLIELWEDGVAIGVVGDYNASDDDYFSATCYVATVITPDAGTHTYAIRAYKQGGAGGSVGPAFIYGSNITTSHDTRPAYLAVVAASDTVEAPGSDTAIPEALIDAKGDLIVGVVDNLAGRLGIGTDGQVLTANSGASAGVDWEDPASTSGSASNPDQVVQLATQVTPSTISNSKYNAFGIMGQLASGDLVTVYREGTSHASDAGVIKMRTSTDQGRTWSSATSIASEASVDLRNVGGGVTATGRIVVFYGRYDYTGVAWLNQGYIYSDDDGATWSSYTAISHASDTGFSPYGNMVKIGADTYLQGWYGDDGTNFKQRVVLSTDNGATWGSAIVVANSTTVHYQEGSFAYLGGSHVVALMRDGAGTTFSQFLSTDNGASWSSQGTTSFDSWSTPSPPSLVAYRNPNGKREVTCYYTNRTALKTRVVYATADSLIAGTAGWSTYTDLTTPAGVDSGYPAVCHPLGSPSGVGWTYNATSSSVATMVFFIAAGPTAAAVSSLAKSGSSDLTGAVTLSEGTNITLTQVGQDIEIASSASGGSTWSVLTNGDPVTPELIFDGTGDVIMVETLR